MSDVTTAGFSVEKAPTGIAGLDEITGGGLPKARPTLVCGSAGCGKTLLAIEFLAHGATEFNEPGVFVAFEENVVELTQNARSLGVDLAALTNERKLLVDYVHLDRSEIDETGEYDLDGLFIRLGHAIDSIGAKRVVIDSIETLFSGLSNDSILRAELRRLFRWLKEKHVTTIVTGERGDGTLTRHGLEEYISDCVILLDHRVSQQVSTRRVRVVKYRGSRHGTNEYPFLIHESGFSVFPVTSLGLEHRASNERIGSGVDRLDAMLGGGVFRGSSVLISGTAGTGKTSIAAHFADAACRRGERCLFFAFEESSAQFVRNMRSIGLDLQPWIDKGLLKHLASRPTVTGLESHLANMHQQVKDFSPALVIIDPISSFINAGTPGDASQMLLRVVDFLKSELITAVLTHLANSGPEVESNDIGISSLIDSWMLLRDIESQGERNRVIYVLKSRGTAHSNQVREFSLTSRGIVLRDVYVGPEGVLTGSMRMAQEARERATSLARVQEMARLERELDRKRRTLDAQISALRADFEQQEEEMRLLINQQQQREHRLDEERHEMRVSRKADANGDSARPENNSGRSHR